MTNKINQEAINDNTPQMTEDEFGNLVFEFECLISIATEDEFPELVELWWKLTKVAEVDFDFDLFLSKVYYDKGETIKLWLEIEEYADIHNEDGWGPYYVEVSFTPKDRNDLMEIKTYILSSIFTKFYYLINDSSLEEEFEYQCGEAYAYMREALFATNTIEEIQS